VAREELPGLGIAPVSFGDPATPTLSLLCVPLLHEGRVLGVMSTQSYRPNAYTAQDLEVLETIATQAATVIENVHLQRQALDLAIVEERNRLARELHDSVTQMLFSITVTLQAGRVLLGRDPALAEQQMDKAQQTAQEALAEMRSLIHQLRPAGMRDQGLVAALTSHVADFQARTGIAATFHHTGESQLTEAQEQALFRIAQEALNNVAKHAEAQHVEVSLTSEPEAVTLAVRDDGRGLPAARPADASPTWGITGMRERTEILGGTLTIESESESGTVVRARLPLVPAPVGATANGREEDRAWSQ
jgi:signal transduction histidine kinase